MARPIIYDLETSGFCPKKNRIIEIAAYDIQNNKYFNYLVNPSGYISRKISNLTQITNKMLWESVKFGNIISRFNDFCQGDVILVAHNNDKFDKRFLEEEYKRLGQTIPSNWQFIDTLTWTKHKYPGLKEYKLKSLATHFEVKEQNTHRALGDVKCLYRVFEIITKDHELEEILEYCRTCRKVSKDQDEKKTDG